MPPPLRHVNDFPITDLVTFLGKITGNWDVAQATEVSDTKLGTTTVGAFLRCLVDGDDVYNRVISHSSYGSLRFVGSGTLMAVWPTINDNDKRYRLKSIDIDR